MLWPLALACAISVALRGCSAADHGWQPQKELTFKIVGQDVAGLPQLKAQYAGFQYIGDLRVQTHSSRVLLLKFFNMSFTKFQEDLPQGWWNGPKETFKNKTKQLPISTSTVVVKLRRDMSPELVLQSGLDAWQENFIKGVVSHLLIYLNENTPSGNYMNNLKNDQAKDVFSVLEDSVSGRCEVMYEISPLTRQMMPHNHHFCDSGKQIWEITKTRNFSNCLLLSEDHAHLPSSDCPPGGSNCGQFWTRTTVTQMIGCGDMKNLLLLSSVSSSVKSAQLHLEKNTQGVVNSKVNITLTSVVDLKSKFNAPQNKQFMNTLLYSATFKELSSQKCKDTLGHSEENDDVQEDIDLVNQINPTKEDDNKTPDSTEPGKLGFRNRRAIKYSKYRTNSDEQQSNRNSEEEQNSDPNHKFYKTGKSKNKKQKYNGDDRTSDENSKFLSAESNYQPKRKVNENQHSEEQSYDHSSEDSNKQNSEELDLENVWNIYGKNTRKSSPDSPFNLFSLAHKTSKDLSCLHSKLRQIIDDIASDLKEIDVLPEKNTMDKLSIAVDICRSLSFDQLSEISEDIFESHNGASTASKSDERKVFRDVITMCGSHQAFKVIKSWVERQEIEGEEAAQVVSSLPKHIFSPSKYLVEDFFDMVQKISEKENEQLTVTSVLSFSNLVRSACVNRISRQHRFSSFIKPQCDEDYVPRYVQWLSKKMSSDDNLRRVYIEALGNVGSPLVTEILKSIALNPEYHSFDRTSAVFAMRYRALKRSPEMAPLLLSLYHNYSMPVSARIASVALLVYTEPSLPIWQRLAISTWYEPSSAVSQFVSSTIHNIASTKDSLYSEMTKAAMLVKPLTRPKKVDINQPFNLMTSRLSKDLDKLIIEQISWMQFSDFSNIYYRHSSRYSGFSRTNIQASFSVSNSEELWSELKNIIKPSDIRKIHSQIPSTTQSLDEISDTLNLRPRSMPPLQGELHLKVNNMMERMILINKDTLQSLAKGGRKLVSEVLRGGKMFSYQKADMDGFHISTTTEMGFPVGFSVRTPWIIRLKGGINTTMEGLALESSFMYSAQMLSSISIMSPWDNVAHMAGAYGTNFVQVPPLRLVSSMDSASDSVKIRSDYMDKHRLLYLNMQPFTSQQRIKDHQPALLSPNTVPVKLGESVQMPITGMNRFLNTVYSSERPGHFNTMDLLKQARGVVGFPMVFENMESRTFETLMSPLHPVTANFSMSVASKSLGLMEYESPKGTLISKMLNTLDKITSLGQNPFMSSFRFFGGLFGGSEEPSSTINPTGEKRESSENPQSNNPNSDNNFTTTETPKQGKDNNEESRNNNQPKDEVSASQEKVGKDNLVPKVYTVTYESAVGSFNASQVDPFANSEQGNAINYLLTKGLSEISSGSAVVYALDIQLAVPERPINVSVYTTYATTHSKRVDRLGLFVKKDQSKMKITAVHEGPADISSNLSRRIAEVLLHNLYMDFVHSTNNQDIKLFMKANLGLSRSELIELKNSPWLRACSENGTAAINIQCQQLREQSQRISFGNITLHYSNNAKLLEDMAVKYISAAKVMIPGTEEKSGEGINAMTMLLDIDRKSQSADALVTTPQTSIKIRRFSLSQLPLSTLAEWATQPNVVPEYCGVSSNRFRTFDGGEFTYDMSNDWHLVLYDVTRKYGISVMARSSNNTMEIEINKENQIVMRIEEGPKVTINEKLQPLDNNHPVMVMTDVQKQVNVYAVYTPDDSVRVVLPNEQLDLKYSNSNLVVKAGAALQGRLSGICGSYFKTGIENYLNARGRIAKSPAEFAVSFKLRGNVSPKFDSDNYYIE